MTGTLTRRIGAMGIMLLVGLAGCKTPTWGPAKESKKAARSMKETYEYLGKAAVELQATNSALDRLSTTPDLQAWLKEYSQSVAKLQEAAGDARDRWQHMKANSQAYIEEWDEEIVATKNPQIQDSMEQRRQRVAAGFDKVVGHAMEVRDAYGPYVQDLTEIEKALKIDLTPAGVKALEPSVAKAKADGAVVMAKLDQLGKELDMVAGKMSTMK